LEWEFFGGYLGIGLGVVLYWYGNTAVTTYRSPSLRVILKVKSDSF
jgi:hypothetical protein